jgi:riboflavin kinase / FMN adenylyltransferase
MVIHNGFENLNLRRPVVTLGIFDGMHRGHRFLIDRLISRSKEMNGESVVITFNPHPRLVLDNNNPDLRFLTSFREKVAIFENTGIDHLIVIEFTREFSRIPACDFVKNILVSKINARHLIVGHDHHFGYRGKGNFNTVKSCAELNGISAEQVSGFMYGKSAVSSSLIRDLLSGGKTEQANELLGYNYSIRGTVIEGKKLGRKIGFPTANILPEESHKLIPANGVYAVKVLYSGSNYRGVMSVGINPTVNPESTVRSIEVNIFNFNREIYGEQIEVIFIARIRDEQKFNDLKTLANQISIDKEEALRLLD